MTAATSSLYKWANEDGEFKRQVSSFRDKISKEPGARFPPEKNRYILYGSYACPWFHGTLIMLTLKGLRDVIELSIVDPIMGPEGWHFSSNPGCIPDPVNQFSHLRQVYFSVEPNYSGRFTVPCLYDKIEKTIVSNESSEIIHMLDDAFEGDSYYPEHLRKAIDENDDWVYDMIQNGVYKTGFATKQQVYEHHCKRVFEGLDRIEDILSKNTFLMGNEFTVADVRLFPCLVRFDPVYVGHFKCNLKTIEKNYPHILRWLKQVYNIKGIKETVNMDHIKRHYYMSHIQINPNQICPLSNGPNLETV